MHKAVYLLSAALICGTPVAAQVNYGESVPVQLEASDDLDACTLGVIANVGEDSSAMVRAGPDAEYDTVDYLSDGDYVWVCQMENDHFGIVYGSDEDTDCEVSSPAEETVNYSGPCDTGWVATDWVEIVAG